LPLAENVARATDTGNASQAVARKRRPGDGNGNPAGRLHLCSRLGQVQVTEARAEELESLVAVLSEADEDDDRIRAEMAAPGRVTYRAVLSQATVGAAVMRWEPDESELLYIVILADRRGHGHGKALVTHLLAEARERGVASVVVGTANCSLDNIAFYQRCGFRMDSVRRDYFAYIDPPITENGIEMRDMLVFRVQLR
jgi:ribosomal protein S18 acetylase RimI-like enzyme